MSILRARSVETDSFGDGTVLLAQARYAGILYDDGPADGTISNGGSIAATSALGPAFNRLLPTEEIVVSGAVVLHSDPGISATMYFAF